MTGVPDAVTWAEAEWIVPETRRLMVCRPWQRTALLAMFPTDGSPSPWETFLISTVKKAGKTTLNAVATMYAALTLPAPELVLVVANDMGQAQGRVFAMIVEQCRLQGLTAAGEVIVTKDEIRFTATGTVIRAVPCDYAGEAGGIFGVSSWTELWAFEHEGQVRLWEELTPIPNRRSLRIVDTYAGYAGVSPVLEPMWKRALAGTRLEGEIPVFTDGLLWALIDTGEAAQERAWRGSDDERVAYYAEQAKSLRPGTFRRLHLNEWQTAEEAFVTAEQWDSCVDVDARPVLDRYHWGEPIFVGVDAATKRDCAAVVAVSRRGERVHLIDHRIWQPSKTKPLDLEATIEAFVLDLRARFSIGQVLFDPMQMARSATTLKRVGVPIEELTQYTANLQASGQALYDLLRSQALVLYPDDELRRHVLNARAVHSARGWKLDKEKSSMKIDGAVALSFACLAALRRSSGEIERVSYMPRTGPVTIRHGDLTLVGKHHLDIDPDGRRVVPAGWKEVRGRR